MPCLRIGPGYGSRRVCGVSLYSDRRLPQEEKSVRVRRHAKVSKSRRRSPSRQRSNAFSGTCQTTPGLRRSSGTLTRKNLVAWLEPGSTHGAKKNSRPRSQYSCSRDQKICEVQSAPAQGLTLTGRHPSLHRNPTLPLDGEKKTRGGEQDPGGCDPIAHGVRRRHLVSQQPARLRPRQIVAPPQGPRRVVAAVDTIPGKEQITASGACCRGHRPRQHLKTEAAAVSHTHQRHPASARHPSTTIPPSPPHPDMRHVVRPSIWGATRVQPARSPFVRYAPGA